MGAFNFGLMPVSNSRPDEFGYVHIQEIGDIRYHKYDRYFKAIGFVPTGLRLK